MSDDNLLERLNELLSNIGKLFEEALMQKHDYKTNHQISELSLKQAVCDLISSKKQNEILRLSILHFKDLFATALKVLSAINFFSNDSIQENLHSLVRLQKLFIEMADKVNSFTSAEVNVAKNSSFDPNEEEKENFKFPIGVAPIKIEKPCTRDFNYPAEASTNNEPSTSSNRALESGGSSSELDKAVQESLQNENSLLKQMLLSVNDPTNMAVKPMPLMELVGGRQSSSPDEQVTTTTGDLMSPPPSSAQVSAKVKQETTFPPSPRGPEAEFNTPTRRGRKTPTINDLVTESPVFKDGVTRRTGSLVSEDNGRKLSSPQLLMNEGFVENSGKRSENSSKVLTPSKERGKKRKMVSPIGVKDFYSPVKTPPRPLVKSNDREAQINKSGSKKMLQTRLNIDCFKKNNTPTFYEPENKEKHTSKRLNLMEQFQKVIDEEDDFIVDSPVKVLNGVKKEGVGSVQDLKHSHSSTAVVDLDETLVSPSVVRNIANNHVLENTLRIPTEKCSPTDKSSDCNSAAFPYQRSAVRKKAERKQLQGHSCAECLKYYKSALGDVNTMDLNNIVNRCSRHRNMNPPSLDDTPPGYWKPFLTPPTANQNNKAK